VLRARIRKEISTFILPDPNPLHCRKTRVKLRFANYHLCPSWQFIRKLNSFLCFGFSRRRIRIRIRSHNGSSEPDRLLKVMSNENRDGSKQDAENVYAPVVLCLFGTGKGPLPARQFFKMDRLILVSTPSVLLDNTFQRNSNTVFFLLFFFLCQNVKNDQTGGGGYFTFMRQRSNYSGC
jgi:hypothetical protein